MERREFLFLGFVATIAALCPVDIVRLEAAIEAMPRKTFERMLNEHLSYDLLREELMKRTWLLDHVAVDNTWPNYSVIVPFKDH